jgi:hypothetical protein
MRRLLATALALGAARGAQADPAAPQISPQPARHEDAQRLREQLRGLDRGTPAPPAVPLLTTGSAPTGSPAASTADAPVRPGFRIAGIVLLSIAGASAITTVGLFAGTPNDPAEAASYDTPKLAFGLTTLVAGVAGFVLLGQSRSVQVAPTVTPKAVGLAISGRL